MTTINFKEIRVSTTKKVELINITNNIESFVETNNIKNGLCVVFIPHTTATIIVNENETGLKQDIIDKIEMDYQKYRNWLHDRIDNNANAHIVSAFTGPSTIFPIMYGKILKGTWQSIFLLELDGPRNKRRIIVQVLGT